jgi:hypothetical protein
MTRCESDLRLYVGRIPVTCGHLTACLSHHFLKRYDWTFTVRLNGFWLHGQICHQSVISENELPSSHRNLEKDFIVSLSERLKSVLAREANLLLLVPPIIVCGYIHSQLHDLFLLTFRSAPLPKSWYLFSGDVVDRVDQSLFTIIELANLKAISRISIFVLRDNQHATQINVQHGRQAECPKNGYWKVSKHSSKTHSDSISRHPH